MVDEIQKLVVFKKQSIRRAFYQDEWWFAVVDVVAALTDSKNPASYLKDIRRRDSALNALWPTIVYPLLLKTEGGEQKVNCANTESIFRIIQSIPSAKAEPFKRWLAKVGYERVQEIEISKAAFGMTPNEYKKHKNLQRENLRDHMTDLELIFSMLSEASTTEITRNVRCSRV